MITEPIAPPRGLAGRAPGGMWWVAWRQHRFAVLVSLGVLVILAVTLLVFGLSYRSALAAAAIDQTACSDPYRSSSAACAAGWAQVRGYQLGWGPLHLPMMLLPPMVGVIVGASVFAQEREHGTQMFALTQSIGRTRWYLTKSVVVIVPLFVAILAVGLLADWVRSAPGLGSNPMDTPEFQSVGPVPAAFALIGFGVAVPAGLFLRTTVASYAAAFALTAILVAGLGYTMYRDLVPHDRLTYGVDLDAATPMPEGALVLGFDYLDAEGRGGQGANLSCTSYGPIEDADAAHAHWRDCLERAGIVSMQAEYLDAGRRLQLTLTLAGICAAIAAAGLALGWARIRRRAL